MRRPPIPIFGTKRTVNSTTASPFESLGTLLGFPSGRWKNRKRTLLNRLVSTREQRRWDGKSEILAVFRFMIRSNFLGDCTGRSDGFAPRRILSM